MSLEGEQIERGLKDVAEAIHHLARAVQGLGNADAATPMGGMEALGQAILEAANTIAEAMPDDGPGIAAI